jgi:hypothetical protein
MEILKYNPLYYVTFFNLPLIQFNAIIGISRLNNATKF